MFYLIKMRYRLFTILMLLSLISESQGFNRQYHLSHSGLSACTDAFEAPSGNIILTGVVKDTLKGANILCIVVTDVNGNFLWRKDYGRTSFQYLANGFISRSVMTDANYFYLYTAATDSNNKYFSALLKFNYNGDTLWQKKYYDTTDYLYVQGLTKSLDNGFLLTGFFEGTLRTTLLIKTDVFGDELWRKKIQKGAGINTQAGHKIIQDSASKKIVIAGYQYEADGTQPGGFSGYANIIVTDSVGTVITKTTFSGPCGSGFRDLIQTQDKKCVAVGFIDQCNNVGGMAMGTRRNKGFAVKFDLNNLNNVIWQKQFDTLSYINHNTAIVELSNGDLVIAGGLDTLNNYNLYDKAKVRIINLDQNGILKWKKYLKRDDVYENTKFVISINKTADGGFLLANQLSYLFPEIKPYSVIKIDSTACDSSLAYCALITNTVEVGIKEFKTDNSAFKIYPNPAKESLFIEVNSVEETEISFIDIYGREVKRVKLEQKIKIDLNDLSKGIYFLNILKNKETLYTTKLIKE